MHKMQKIFLYILLRCEIPLVADAKASATRGRKAHPFRDGLRLQLDNHGLTQRKLSQSIFNSFLAYEVKGKLFQFRSEMVEIVNRSGTARARITTVVILFGGQTAGSIAHTSNEIEYFLRIHHNGLVPFI